MIAPIKFFPQRPRRWDGMINNSYLTAAPGMVLCIFRLLILMKLNGEPGGARTRDHRIKSAMLYQLSYRLPDEG